MLRGLRSRTGSLDVTQGRMQPLEIARHQPMTTLINPTTTMVTVTPSTAAKLIDRKSLPRNRRGCRPKEEGPDGSGPWRLLHASLPGPLASLVGHQTIRSLLPRAGLGLATVARRTIQRVKPEPAQPPKDHSMTRHTVEQLYEARDPDKAVKANPDRI
jgi:hypothetical protein